MSGPADDPPFTPDEEARIRRRIREQGMAFEVFLPEGMADWLRGKLAAGVYDTPADAAFVAFRELIELDRHPEVRRQLLDAVLRRSLDDPRPGVPVEEVSARFKARLRALATPDPMSDPRGPLGPAQDL